MMQMNAEGHQLSIAAIKWTILQQGVREPTGVAIPARGACAIPGVVQCGREEAWWSMLLKLIPLCTCGHLAVSTLSPSHHYRTGLSLTLIAADSMCEDCQSL